jgi:electron transfer flavoprotein alpha subunit
MSGPVIVLVEAPGGEPDRLSLEALAMARGLAGALGGGAVVEAVVMSEPATARAAAAALAGHGAAVAHCPTDARLEAYAPAAWAAILGAVVDARGAVAAIGPASDRGSEVLAHVAARAGLPLAANVVAVDPGPSWRLTRQRWAGSLLEDATLDAAVRLMTAAPHAFPAEPAEAAGDAPPAISDLVILISDGDFAVRVTSRESPVAGAVSLADAKVVVSGGRGVGSSAGFAIIEELAGLLGGAVGVSRAVTSAGWRPHAEQVGQTGTRVAPELYVACGISGAIQHIVGCKAAKRILVINTDPDSPIMGVADFAVIGDLHAIVPAISAEIRRRHG